MVYVITEGCIDLMDRTCVKECPVDCIYEGKRSLYINPEECIDCGACEPVCPNEAIFFEEDIPDNLEAHRADNGTFFTTVLPDHELPLGKPRGARKIGAVGHDTELVRNHPVKTEDA